MPRPTGHLRSQDSYLHIPQIYCNTLLSTNSTARILREEPAITGLTRTPTEQNVTTMDGLVIAMCFPMVCCDGERREDYDTQYSERRRTAPASAARTADALRVHLHHVQLLMSLFPPNRCSLDTPLFRIKECVQPLLQLSLQAASTVSETPPGRRGF